MQYVAVDALARLLVALTVHGGGEALLSRALQVGWQNMMNRQAWVLQLPLKIVKQRQRSSNRNSS